MATLNQNAETATIQENAATVANQTTQETATNAGKEKTTKNNDGKKRKSIPPMWRVLGKARKQFEVQVAPSNEVKLKCINNYISAETSDVSKFWSDYFDQVDKILNSRRFLSESASLNCNSVNLAEHIVFLGSAKINEVLKDGIVRAIGNDYLLYKEQLSPTDAVINPFRNIVSAFLNEVKKTA